MTTVAKMFDRCAKLPTDTFTAGISPEGRQVTNA